MRPLNPAAEASGSTRHSPVVPSISTGMPASPTCSGRATPSARSRRSSRIVFAFAAGHDLQLAGIDALGHVPQPLASLPSCDRDLAPPGEEREHLSHIAVVGPSARGPRHRARVGDVTRAAAALTARSVSRTWRRNASFASSHWCTRPPSVGHAAHVRQVQAEPRHRPDHGDRRLLRRLLAVVLEHGVVDLERPPGASPVRRSRRAGSTRRGRRSERPRPSDRAAAGSAGRRAWRSRWAGWRRAAARGSRSVAHLAASASRLS